MRGASEAACCSPVGSFAVGRARGPQIDRSGRRGRRSLLVPHTPALQHKISLGLQSPIPKERRKGVSLPS